MIKKFRVKNFKAFKDTGDIEIKPITVLAGPNSGGKSSVLQSLLLLKQTLESEESISLNLDGRFLQYSSFNELIFGKPPLRSCKLTYEILFEMHIPREAAQEYFSELKIPDEEERHILQSNIEFSFRYKESEKGKKRILVDRFNLSTNLHGIKGPQFSFKSGKKGNIFKLNFEIEPLSKLFRDKEIVESISNNFLPGMLLIKVSSDDNGENLSFIPLPDIFHNPSRRLEYELKENLKYLGPLREEPHRAYLHSGNPFPEIGKKGEYAAQILWLEKDKKVEYLPGLNGDIQQMPMIDAVKDAFKRIGINQVIDVKSEKSVMYQILFSFLGKKGRKRVTIADVGFGISQLLPIIVMGIRSSKESLLMFEQPEIHLHPKLQANLADFFLTLAMSGKRVMIETHSDHFINRLRRRIAEDKTDRLKDIISILFVRPPEDGKSAVIEPLKVDRYGIIENWPPDFLPESADESEAIFLAKMKKMQEQSKC